MVLDRSNALRRLARRRWGAGQAEAAVRAAWAAWQVEPRDRKSKVLVARLLGRFPRSIDSKHGAALLQLLQDRDVDPRYVSGAGWTLIQRETAWEIAVEDGRLDALATDLADNELALTLLRETPVCQRGAERVLTGVRRWLLVSGRWRQHRALVDAMAAQTELNGGAWPFDESERALLDQAPGLLIAAAYLPVHDETPTPAPTLREADSPTARAVAGGYERWPYPTWRRVMAQTPRSLTDEIRAIDPEGPDLGRDGGDILVAGCGTGKEAANVALKFPHAAVTAIDVSEASLLYARRQSEASGVLNCRFLALDLHDISALNDQFDVIYCSGVLHHLADPEAGWAALAAVLRPGGVMKIMIYSRIARLWVAAARTLIPDLAAEPVTDDVLRRVRQRLLDRTDVQSAQQVANSYDFSTLAGTHDLLLHPHEDPFDVSRISRAMAALNLRLLEFVLPTPDARSRFDAMFPDDPLHRDVESWARFEKSEPGIFGDMYEFWCRSGGTRAANAS